MDTEVSESIPCCRVTSNRITAFPNNKVLRRVFSLNNREEAELYVLKHGRDGKRLKKERKNLYDKAEKFLEGKTKEERCCIYLGKSRLGHPYFFVRKRMFGIDKTQAFFLKSHGIEGAFDKALEKRVKVEMGL